MTFRFSPTHWSSTATSQVLDIAKEYHKYSHSFLLSSVPPVTIDSIRSESPLHRHIQRLLDITLESQKPFDISYSSLWQLLKDKGTELENRDGMFSISLHNYNIEVYSLFKIKSEICKKYSDKESDDKVKDLLIAAKAYYEKLFNPPNLIELGYSLRQSGPAIGMLNFPGFRRATEGTFEDIQRFKKNTPGVSEFSGTVWVASNLTALEYEE